MADNTHTVTIYSTDWCGYCKMAKQYLDSKSQAFVEKNIEQDEAAKTELLEKINGDFRGVPVIDIDGKIILGFDRPSIDAALAA
jgi:glutaredoxin 3